MNIQEPGVLETSSRYFFTPSSFAEQTLFYPTRIAHFYCTPSYYFSGTSAIGMEPSHRLHYMLFLIADGSMELMLDGTSCSAGKGDAVLFDCKRPHEYHAGSAGVEFRWLVFDSRMMEYLFGRILEIHGGSHVFSAPRQTDLQLLIDRLIAIAAGSGHTAETAISELIYSILCCLFLTKMVPASPERACIENAMYYMDNHYKESLSVPDIASVVGLSPSYFTRCFRQETGYSPHEYLTLRRISAAKDRLLSTSGTIQQIAAETGYNSEENFIRSFKKAVGVSPASFRRYPV